MPAISFFIDDQDVKILVDRLNADPDIAFIVADGPHSPQEAYRARGMSAMNSLQGDLVEGVPMPSLQLPDTGYRQRWKAVQSTSSLADGDHCLWHVPAGPLPLVMEAGPDKVIPDPWSGWTEHRPGADSTVPYFSPANQAVISLTLWTRHRPYSDQEKDVIPLVYSYWDGSDDLLVVSDFGWAGSRHSPAPPQTQRWWNRLKAWLSRTATRVADPPQILWAFPSALQKLQHGMAYDARGWELNKEYIA